MSGSTPRFGLLTLGKADELGAQDAKFSDADRLLLDGLVTQVIEEHRHNGVVPPTAPNAAPSVAVSPTGGTLPANQSIFYRVALVDGRGQEYVASQMSTVITPATLSVPAPPALTQAVGGSLQAGAYLYLISAYTPSTGYETMPSRSVSGTLVDGNKWTLTLPALPKGASGFNIYRKSPTDSEPVYLASVDTDAPWDDTGLINPNRLRSAPTTNTTAATASAQIDLAGGIPAGYTMRIYRSLDQGDWSRSLVARVATLPYVDTGHATQSGVPLSRSIAFGGAPKIDLADESAGVPPMAMSTWAKTARLKYPGALDLGMSSWFWLCDYDIAIVLGARAVLGSGSVPDSNAVQAIILLQRFTDITWSEMDAPVLEIAVGGNSGPYVPFPDNPTTHLATGDMLTLQVTAVGGGAIPTDRDLTIELRLATQHGSSVNTYLWQTT